MKEKLKSRKFWLSVASFLGCFSTAIAGMSTDNTKLILIGVVCGCVSSSIYTISESIIDSTKKGE